MNSLSPINKDLFRFSLLKTPQKTDRARLDHFLAHGADPNVVVNGQPIFLNFWFNNKLDLVEHLLPKCDFLLRFGGCNFLGFATIGVTMYLNDEKKFKKYMQLFLSFVQSGADINSLCRPNMVAFNRPCVDVLFDALRCNDHTTGDLLLQLFEHNIYPKSSYWINEGIDLDSEQPYLSTRLPICFNRWWRCMQNIRQKERIGQVLSDTSASQISQQPRKL